MGSVAGKEYARIFPGRPAPDLDATLSLTQLERREVSQLGPKAGRPDDRIHGLKAAVRERESLGLDPGEHRLRHEKTTFDAGDDAPRARNSGAAHPAGQRPARSRGIILCRYGRSFGLEIEVSLIRELDRPSGDPGEGGCLMLEFEQESDRRGSTTDHRDTLVSELGSIDEVDGVHVASEKLGGARVPGPEGGTPGSGRVDHDIRLQLQCLTSVGVANEEVGARTENRGHDRWPNHLEAEMPFVLPVEIGDNLLGGEGAVDGLEAQIEIGHRGQVVDAVGRTDAQRLPAVLPRAAGRGSPIEDDHVGARVQPQFLQVMSDRESRLPRTDHDDAMAV